MPRISTAPTPLRIEVLGDSISAPNDGGLCGWCGYLDAMLTQASIGHTWTNRAVAGTDCGYTSSNITSWLVDDAPGLVLLDCGTNNIPIDSTSQAAMGQQWRAIVEAVHTRGARLGVSFIGYSNTVNISLAGSGLPVAEGDANDVIAQNMALYPADWFAAVAHFDTLPGDLDYLKSDGIHPNPLGQQRMADIWYRALEAAMGWPDTVPEPCGMWGYRPGGAPPSFTPCTATS
jgi:lysophospholipase L1-like esterase